ncbi:precursor to secretory protein Ssp120 [Guyanagaster necrorhizus]|uniref:Precursor to secretory protein Ssp120 n=1 Tax=Guyanagaster necrorhizus TaxID=856835 RepID=A0A9P7W3R5_9AGAR|nr:precursor to secretory protein Ssp120 [Guyanagaster necrorhizus MCA 3950]KAG7452087.1 precursor to secretory protein Ssp120 [Guyanagaster necrorhizus MCA 3950]
MRASLFLSLISSSLSVLGHGHSHDGPADGESVQEYAQRHMAKEHHIESFDSNSFFQIHDLDRDGHWDKDEIQAIYGVHHVYSQKKSKDDIEHQEKADHIVKVVLEKLDKNGDGKITAKELADVGLGGLPNFDDLGAEGHHYDVESEFFLHHEEEFHNTPETQVDEAYIHPEDIEHFAHHEDIELKEAEKEAAYQGITVEEVLRSHEPPPEEHVQMQGADQEPLVAPHPHDEQYENATPQGEAPKPKITRVTPPEKQDPGVRFRGAKSEGDKKGAWGSGEEGYLPPSNAGDKMRKNMPYKNRMQYKFKRNWNDF